MATQGRQGFTLVETIAAVVVLAVAVPPMLWSIRSAHGNRVDHVLTSRARWLVMEKLEDVIADRHSATRGYAYLTANNYPPEPTIVNFPNYRRSVSLTETGPNLTTPGIGYMTATVDVTWQGSKRAMRTLSLSTVLTEYRP